MNRLLLAFLLLTSNFLFAQLTVTTSNNAAALAQMLAGQGVVVTNATLNCAGTAAGTYTGGQGTLNFNLDEGIVLGTGNVSAPNAGGLTCLGTNHGRGGYNRLNSIAGAATQDACILEFDVEVTTSTLEFKYVFGSDEYPEYVGSSFNDAFGFFISGPGIAGVQNIGFIPGSNTPITINTVNNGGNDTGPCTNCQYYRAPMQGISGLDGTTTVLTATAKVIPCETYHFVLAIADGSDGCWDSSVFLEKSSLVSVGVDMTQPQVSGNLGAGRIYEGCDSAIYTFDLPTQLANDYGFKIAIKGTAINGTDYRFLQDSLVIPAGQTSYSFTILPLVDSLVDPGETVEICILDPCDGTELACEMITIEELEADITPESDICYGDSVQLSVTYNANYNYQWSPSASLTCSNCDTPKAFPTDTTVYSVVVSDKTCQITRQVKVNVAAGALPPIQDTIACIDREKSVDVSTPGFDQYEWTPATTGLSGASSSSPTFTVLDSAVTYTVVASNDLGCELTQDITITPRPPVEAQIATTDILCFGENTGRLNVQVSSPTAIDSFIWADGFLGNPRSNLLAGPYALRMVDIYGCELLLDTVLLQPDAPLVATASELTPTRCGGNNGEAEVVISGGTEPYTITWSPVPGNANTITGIYAGIYRADIRDAHGCLSNDTALVRNDDSDQKDATITPFGPFCQGATPVQVEAAMPNGQWSGPGIDASGLFTPADAGNGTHRIIYRIDDGFCSDADTFFVEVNSAFQADINPIPVQCELNGPVTLKSVTSGGLYWGAGIADSAFAIFRPALAGPGNHWIYHLVEGECGELDSLEVTVVGAEKGDIQPVPDFCPTGSADTLLAGPNGGTWSGAGISSIGVFDPTLVGAGSFPVYFTPDSSCRIPDTALVLVVDTLLATAQQINLDCAGDLDGALSTAVSGGQTPYNFAWADSTIGNSPNANGLGAGNYDLTITDNTGCSVNITHIISEPPGMSFTQAPNIQDASCFGLCDGSADVFVTGGGGSYSYAINPAGIPAAGGAGFQQLCAGAYEITVTDNNNCQIRDSVVINQPEQIIYYGTPTTAFCNQPNGGVNLDSISGGAGNYSYSWSNGSTNDSLLFAVPGGYNLTVTDANNCSESFSFTVPNSGGPSLSGNYSPALCNGTTTGKAWVSATGGIPPYNFQWEQGLSNTDTLSNVAAGTYQVVVADSTLCADTLQVTVTEPTPVQLQDPNDTTLCDSQVLNFTLLASGGTAGYTYEINGAASPATNTLNSPGTYTVQAFDANNCPSNQQQFNVSYLAPISVNISPEDSICPGATTMPSLQIQGGRAPYSTLWADGQQGTQASYNTAYSDQGKRFYPFTISDGCSPDLTDSASAYFFVMPDLNLQVAPLTGCVPHLVSFSANNQDFSNIEWRLNNSAWSKDFAFDSLIQGVGDYQITVAATSSNGCNTVQNYPNPIEVYPIPQAEIKVFPTQLTILNSRGVMQLNTNFTLAGASWRIHQGADTIARYQGLYPAHTFAERPDTYGIHASFISNRGCVNEAFAEVEVKSEDVMYVPTAFTPNNDGTNDAFSVQILGEKPNTFNVHVFDRWGEKIYTSSDIDFQWDGSYMGEPCKGDVYVWSITYTTATGIFRSLQGRVTLVR